MEPIPPTSDTAGSPRSLRPSEKIELLEILSSLGAALGGNSGEPAQILMALRVHLNQLLPFRAIAFYLVDPDSAEFKLTECNPASQTAAVRSAVDGAIDDGTFAWALRQSRPLLLRGEEGTPTLVLHSIATRSRHLGMFAGIVDQARPRETDIAMRLLSVMLVQGAYALENAALQLSITRQNLELEATVRERTSQLEVALKAAQESALVKSRFLANMSHEIRTPLNGILGLAELLEGTDLTAEQRSDLRTLRECGRNLLTVLSDILDYSKIEAGKLVLEQAPFSLDQSLRDAVRLMTPLAEQKGLTLAYEPDPLLPARLIGDPARVQQVVLNLLGNAIKFTARGSVSLSVHVQPSSAVDSGSVRLESAHRIDVRFVVADTGIGIPPEVLPTLFQPFTQADASTRRLFGGTGLGLAICRSLCSLMGGDIRVESRSGSGSRFVFELPFSLTGDHTPGGSPPAAVPTTPAEPLRVLVIDDSSVNQLVACRMLTRFGLAPAVATGGRQAIAVAKQELFDLLLIDLQMPEFDGYSVLREIQAHWPPGRRPRCVAMTANALKEDRDKCLGAGFDAFLPKPFNTAQLRAIVDSTPRLAAALP
jgi:signal transduction histidine kinase/CheY-like chemotaxis protein